MNIDYELIALYSDDTTAIKNGKRAFSLLLEDGFIEEKEVMELAAQYNVVVLYEFTESTGYSEVCLINNKGKYIEGATFCLDDIDALREQYKKTKMSAMFNKTTLEKIAIHMQEHNITEREFMNEYVDELLLDLYETKKDQLEKYIKDYFIK